MKVKDLKGKQLKEYLEHLQSETPVFDYTVSELWNADIDGPVIFNRTKQGHKYWWDILTAFKNK